MKNTQNITLEAGKRDIGISIIRIVAMFSIVICHIMSQSNINILKISAQFFNAGVYIFLFMSGFLYGKKEITDVKAFYKGRIIKVLIPVYIFIVLLYVITYFANNTISIKYLFIYLFNLQYIVGGMRGANHLWFITMIVICYLVTPLLHKYKNKLTNKKINISITVILVTFSIIISIFNELTARIILYFITYFLGYIFSENNKNISIKLSVITFFISTIVRIVGRKFWDETILYNIFITSFTHFGIAISVFYILKNLLKKCEDKIKNEKLINYLDEYSFYIYITHYMFFEGPVKTMNITSSFIANVVITLILTYIFSVVLHFIYINVKKLFKL